MPPNGPQLTYAAAVRLGPTERRLEDKSVYCVETRGTEVVPEEKDAAMTITGETTDLIELIEEPECVVTWKDVQSQLADKNCLREGLVAEVLLTTSHLELFDNVSDPVESPMFYRRFPRSMIRFAAAAGDLATAISVVRTWEDRKKGGPKEEKEWRRKFNMNGECLTTIDGMCTELLQRASRPKHRRSQIREDLLPDVNTKDTACHVHRTLTKQLSMVMQKHVCLYMGHESLGYRNLDTGEPVHICPVSAVHLLLRKPQFAICYPKTGPQHCGHLPPGDGPCHHVASVDEDLVLGLPGKKKALEQARSMLVTQVPELENLGRVGLSEFLDRWNGGGGNSPSLKWELLKLCDHQCFDIVLDKEESRYCKMLKLYAPDKFHSRLRDHINAEIRAVREEMAAKSALLSYPKKRSAFYLVMQGFQCNSVLLPGAAVPHEHLKVTPNCIRKEPEPVEIFSSVNVKLAIGEMNPAGNHSDASNPKVKATVLLKKLFADLIGREWSLQDCEYCSYEKITTLTVSVTEYVTARRILLMLDHAQTRKVPIRITNQQEIDLQLRSFVLYLDRALFSVIRHVLLSRLERFKKSPKFCAEYTVFEQTRERVVVKVSAMSSQRTTEVRTKLSGCVTPLRLSVTPQDCMYLQGEAGQHMLQRLSYGKEFVMVARKLSNQVLIYGASSEQQANARTTLESELDKLHLYQRQGWDYIESFCGPDSLLPSDVLVRIHREIFEKKSKGDLKALDIDYKSKALYILCDAKKQKQNLENMSKIIQDLVCENQVEEKEMNVLSLQEERQPECVACYAPVPNKDIYITEGCGHVYCSDCLSTQILTAKNSAILPVVCAGCGAPFTLRELQVTTLHRKTTPLTRMLKASLQSYVQANASTYKFCPRFNCPGIYRSDVKKDNICCCICSSEVCPSCYNELHLGMTCEEYEESTLGVINWMKEHPKSRKQCMNCKMGIDKVDGCNNVRCSFCGKNLCWVCLKVFDQSGDCYAHMDKEQHWGEED